jgi:hypothetical protein
VQNRAQDKIQAALGFAKQLKSAQYKDPRNAERSVVGRTLLAGNREAGLPSFSSDPIYLTAALDMAYDGHLSRETVRKLHSRGIVVNKLGFTTPGEVAREERRRIGRPNSSRYGGRSG